MRTLKESRSAVAADAAKVLATVETIPADIATRSDRAVRKRSAKFGGWSRADYRPTDGGIRDCVAQLSTRDLADITLAPGQARGFAGKRKALRLDLEGAMLRGMILGHANIPMGSVGDHAPGGKSPMGASAHMSAITANVAGLPFAATYAPLNHGKLAPAIVAAQHFAGATALATESIAAVDIPVGRGNAFVPEARRELYGRVGIVLFAGPTENLPIAGDSVDAELCASDLLGQTVHGPVSPAIPLTNSDSAARATMAEIGERCSRLCMPEGFAGHAGQATVRVPRHGGRNVPYATAAEPMAGAEGSMRG